MPVQHITNRQDELYMQHRQQGGSQESSAAKAGMVSLTYDELLTFLRKKGLLLISIELCFVDSDGNEVIDDDYIKEHIESAGLRNKFITNPTIDVEMVYKVKPEDRLVVLANSKDCINR